MMAEGESPDVAIFAALFAEDRPLRLKRVLAQQLADTEEMLTSFGGEEGSVLISDRNQAALKVLKKEMAAGKQAPGDLLRGRPSGRHGQAAAQRIRPETGGNHLAHGVGPEAEAVIVQPPSPLPAGLALCYTNESPPRRRFSLRADDRTN